MKLPRFGIYGVGVLALAVVLNIAAFYTAERSFAELRDADMGVRHTQDLRSVIASVYRRIVDAETGQRGFLLTQDATYLAPYAEARIELPKELETLEVLAQDNPVQVAQFATVRSLLETRFAQIEESLSYKRNRDDDAIHDFLASRRGMVTMNSVRLALDGMRAEETGLYERRLKIVSDIQNRIRRGFLMLVGLNLLLVTLGAMFLSQELRRRRRQAVEANERSATLAQAVLDRTAEMTGLSHHLQQLQENEKATIAREIHDVLGGTLAAAKIDLQLLSDKLAAGDPQRVRITRVTDAIDDTIQVKRRIIEDLRPSLLDNLGVGAALKWQCGEFAKRWGIPCRVELQHEGLRLSPGYGIALYRVVQESLTNINKYAKAKNVAVSLLRDEDHWVLRIADDGVGIDTEKQHNATAHGLVSMRERARALGGKFSVQGQAGRGTVVEVRVPFERESNV